MNYLLNFFNFTWTNSTKFGNYQVPSKVIPTPINPRPYQSIVNDDKESHFRLYFDIAAFAVIGITITYYGVKIVLNYLGAKAFSVTVSFPSERPNRVGETVALKLNFSKVEENGQETSCTPEQFATIISNMTIRIEKENLNRDVAFLKTLGSNKDHFLLRFSLRQSGLYEIVVKCGYFQFVGSPFSFEVLSGPMSPLKTVLNTPNPKIICMTVGKPINIELIPQDTYGNVCPNEDVNCKKFNLSIKLGDLPIDDTEFSKEILCQGKKMYLKVVANECKIYAGNLSFAGFPVHHGSLVFVALTVDEDEKFKSGVKTFLKSFPAPFKASLVSVGFERSQFPSEIWTNINYRQLAISSRVLGFIYYPFMAFCINRRTRIVYTGLYKIDANENDNLITLQISDGIQDCVVIALSPSDARMLLASFSYFQGQKLSSYSFEDKKAVLKSELGGFLSYLRRPKILQIDGSDFLTSSIRNVPTTPGEWLKPFQIMFTNTRVDRISSDSSIEAAKWFELLIEKLFEHNETGLFAKHQSSRLLHPNLGSKRSPRWENEHYEFAGSVIAKCVHDSIIHGMCVNLTHIRFTRSFLAQLVGAPITYKHFEMDDPVFFESHVKVVLDCEDKETSFRFVDKNTKDSLGINLIPNGENIPVTKRNKEKYLNMLADQRLRIPFSTEVNAFRNGFYKIIPQGYIVDFDENELEKIFCGGGRSFDLSDLKKNSRIIGDLTDYQRSSIADNTTDSEFPESEKQKVLRWFWTAVSNMSDEEHENLLKMTTGSLVLPSCGFKDLNPKYTISLTGNNDKPPTGHPSLHQISIGNQSSYEKFEENLLLAVNGCSDLGFKINKNWTENALKDMEDLLQGNLTKSDQVPSASQRFEAEAETETEDEADNECVRWIKDQCGRHCVVM